MLLITVVMTAFSRTAPSATGENTVMQTVENSKADKPTPINRVHRAGLLWLNTTNMGYYGNPDAYDDPCTGKPAVNGEMPGGSGVDFLFVGGIIFGGYLDSATVTVGADSVDSKVFQGPRVTTAYEGWTGANGLDDMCMELWPIEFEDDPSGSVMGRMVESSNVEGRISCLFEDVYDPAATAEEQFNTLYTDKFVQRTPYTGMDDYDLKDHVPMGLEVRQKSYAWSYAYAQKFVIIDYTLYNRNPDGNDIYNFFMGMYLDCDIGWTPPGVTYYHADDLGGFIQKWDGYIDPATDTQKTVDLNLAWAADNDGRHYTGTGFYTATGEPGVGARLDGATGIVTVRVLRNPNPNLRYAFNMYVANSEDEGLDWGPRWKRGLHGSNSNPNNDPIDGETPQPWLYDLTPAQLGYDDYNQDGLTNGAGQPLAGGRVEGRPAGDKGKYMVMSNDEFDYAQYDLNKVDNIGLTDPDYMIGTPYAQANKWQKWLDPSETLPPGETYDGTVDKRNDLANGADTKYYLSFGPLGTEKTVSVAYDSNGDGIVDDHKEKNVWQFGYGDSLKLTMAFIVNENFHTSLDQDPNYANDMLQDPPDGIDPSLYEKGWYDALYNVVWAERVYDIPMHDTYVRKGIVEKGDGWYGEDVGADGIYANTRVTTECWWTDPVAEYGGPDDDESEGNFELDNFTTAFTDPYGNPATKEDDLLPFGREEVDAEGIYGVTGTQANGNDGFGYMVKYDKFPGEVPIGTWVRYGFDNGRIDVGDGVPDFTGPPPPPSPKIEISYENNNVIVEWASKEFFIKEDGSESYSGPEEFLDPFTRAKDFEGYQVQVSPDLNSLNYVEIFDIDNVNFVYEDVIKTGDFLDTPVSADSALVLQASNLAQIPVGDTIYNLVPFGANRSLLEDYSEPNLYNFTSTPATKTITMEDTSGVAIDSLVSYRKYKFTLLNKLYARESYIAVTSSDYGDPKTDTPALKSNPAVNGSSIIPTKLTSTKDVVVVPNPYRSDVDYEEAGWENVDQSDEWKEQDRKIVFLNVPLRSVIKIYTLAGDLVKTIGHNGNARVDARYQYGEYGAAWDLINENDQAVVSGIYLFSVKDADDDGYEFIGKFVIIK